VAVLQKEASTCPRKGGVGVSLRATGLRRGRHGRHISATSRSSSPQSLLGFLPPRVGRHRQWQRSLRWQRRRSGLSRNGRRDRRQDARGWSAASESGEEPTCIIPDAGGAALSRSPLRWHNGTAAWRHSAARR
jgi:hypothetical protein